MVCLLKDVKVQLNVRRTLSSVGTSSSNIEGEEGVGVGGKDGGHSVADEERVVKEFAGAGGDYGITNPVDDYGITDYTASQFDIHERISHFMERVPISLHNRVAENEGDKNGEKDEDDSNMGQFVDATYLTEESTSNIKVALKMRKLTTNKEKEIKKFPKKELNRLLKGCLNQNDISSYMAFLKKRDNNMCKVEPGKKPSMFYSLEFIYFDKERRPQYRESKRMRARHNKIFDSNNHAQLGSKKEGAQRAMYIIV